MTDRTKRRIGKNFLIVCVVPDCKVSLERNRVMCEHHWAMVPFYQQERVADEITPGERPHKDFYWMVSEAIAAVRRFQMAERAGVKLEGDTW